mgnify:CR=1 FL=1
MMESKVVNNTAPTARSWCYFKTGVGMIGLLYRFLRRIKNFAVSFASKYIKVIPKSVHTVTKESFANLNILEKVSVYIKINGIIADIMIPIRSGIDNFGDLKIEREDRIESISISSARIESMNHPV